MPRVLIVEDAEVDRALARALVEEQGELEVETAESGSDALETIEAGAPDIVVTDLIMPGMDGLQLLTELRERHPLLPVIIMTSRGSEETAVQALQLGAASYVPKYAMAGTLVETIESVLATFTERRERADLLQVAVESHSSFVLKNDRTLFRPLIRYLLDSMADFGLFNDMERTRIGVAIEEALNNAAEHGNLELDSALRDVDFKGYLRLMRERCEQDEYRDRRIRFDATIAPDRAVFEIRDDGQGFDTTQVLQSVKSQSLDSTSGRGLTLMRMFMDEVEFNAAGNQVSMTKYRDSAGARGA